MLATLLIELQVPTSTFPFVFKNSNREAKLLKIKATKQKKLRRKQRKKTATAEKTKKENQSQTKGNPEIRQQRVQFYFFGVEEFEMTVLHCKLVVICAMIMAVVAAMTVDASGDHLQQPIIGWLSTTRSPCDGSVGECLGGEEFELDSEISRRILATTKYISYGALQRNTVPCSRRGASYYNCQPGAQANPYSRGCSKITRCRS